MSYNRALDLMAMCLAATQAGQPVRAAKFMHEASNEVSASAAIEAIFAANKKKKPAKKKAKASTELTAAQKVFAELGLDEDEDETAESKLPSDLEAALAAASGDDEDDEEVAESDDEDDEEKEDAAVVAAKAALAKAQKVAKAKKALAEADDSDIEVGEDERVEVPTGGPAIKAKNTASFARALRNLAARQK